MLEFVHWKKKKHIALKYVFAQINCEHLIIEKQNV